MQKYPQDQGYVGSSGQTLTANVSMTLCKWARQPYGAATLLVVLVRMLFVCCLSCFYTCRVLKSSSVPPVIAMPLSKLQLA